MKNEISPRQTNIVVWMVVVISTLMFTAGLFFAFKPDNPLASFWVVLVDMLVMELVVGAYMAFGVLSSATNSESKLGLPVAMHISISTFASVVFFFGIIINIVFLFFLKSAFSGTLLIWIVLAKWLFLTGISAILWIVGRSNA
jgi:hypothetical protein